MYFRDGDGAIQSNHGGGVDAQELIVEQQNGGPIDRLRIGGARVRGGDGGLGVVFGDFIARHRAVEVLESESDEAIVPTAAVLKFKEHEVAFVVDSRRQAGRLKCHQCHERVRLRGSNGRSGHQAGQTQRFAAKFGADEILAGVGRVAFVEQELENLEHGAQAQPELLFVR